MFDRLLEKRLFRLLEQMYPDETRIANDGKYCSYNKIFSHPLEKCHAFKEQVMQLEEENSH